MSRPLQNLKQGFITIRPSPGFNEPGHGYGYDETGRGYDRFVQPETSPEPDGTEPPVGPKPADNTTGAEPQDTGHS